MFRADDDAKVVSTEAATSPASVSGLENGRAYFKEHRALRTEMVVADDTRDFGIGRRVNAENWHALRAVGEGANKRLCDVQAADAQPAPEVATFNQVTRRRTPMACTQPDSVSGIDG